MSIEDIIRTNGCFAGSLHRFLSSLFEYDDGGGNECAQQNITIDYMYKLITQPRFRRTKIDEKTQGDICAKITAALKNNLPIEFAIPFGAYKHWLLPTYPYPDWAEVFNLKHMLSFAGPIAKAYPPGVVLNYTYTSGVMERVSNLPTEAQTKYMCALKLLHSHFQKIAPRGLTLRLIDIRDLYDTGKLEAELESNFADNIANWEQKYPDEEREKKTKSARNNLLLTGIESLTDIGSIGLEKRYLMSAMWCDALDSLSRRRGFNKYEHRIQLVYVRGPGLSLHIGSCRGSNVHFWVGSGVAFLNKKGLFVDKIITARNLKKLIDEGLVREVSVDGVSPVASCSLKTAFVAWQE